MTWSTHRMEYHYTTKETDIKLLNNIGEYEVDFF